jgi:hypothetical protein
VILQSPILNWVRTRRTQMKVRQFVLPGEHDHHLKRAGRIADDQTATALGGSAKDDDLSTDAGSAVHSSSARPPGSTARTLSVRGNAPCAYTGSNQRPHALGRVILFALLDPSFGLSPKWGHRTSLKVLWRAADIGRVTDDGMTWEGRAA